MAGVGFDETGIDQQRRNYVIAYEIKPKTALSSNTLSQILSDLLA